MKYSQARESMQPGDLIGFSGNGLISSVIKLITQSDISHVGVILKSRLNDSSVTVNQLIESTSLGDGYAGVQIKRMSRYIRTYPGNIFWYQLTKESRSKLNIPKMFNFLLSHKNKKYDTPQAILSVLDLMPDSKEDFSEMFCSELTSGGYEAGNLIAEINCSEVTPADQVDMKLFETRQLLT